MATHLRYLVYAYKIDYVNYTRVDKCGEVDFSELPHRQRHAMLELGSDDHTNHFRGMAYRQQLGPCATVCQPSSRTEPSKTIRPSPRSDGNQASPSRRRVTVNGSPDRVQRVVSLPDSPQLGEQNRRRHGACPARQSLGLDPSLVGPIGEASIRSPRRRS